MEGINGESFLKLSVTGKQLCEIAYRKKITRWIADKCPVCDYPIIYLFEDKSHVKFDPGCNCSDLETARATRYQTSSWDLVALWVNSQTDLEKIRKIKEFWDL